MGLPEIHQSTCVRRTPNGKSYATNRLKPQPTTSTHPSLKPNTKLPYHSNLIHNQSQHHTSTPVCPLLQRRRHALCNAQPSRPGTPQRRPRRGPSRIHLETVFSLLMDACLVMGKEKQAVNPIRCRFCLINIKYY